jgi:D-tyrosyl-tRNA(Tyr) deacylase
VKVLIQRVSRAAVRVDGATVGRIGPGLVVLLGVERDDGPALADHMADRTAQLRIFADEQGKMNRSVEDVGGAVLVVSQFTLASNTRKGNRPSFHLAAPPGRADSLYRRYVRRLAERGVPVAEGVFRAMMEVELVNDGPVTLMLDPPGRGPAS